MLMNSIDQTFKKKAFIHIWIFPNLLKEVTAEDMGFECKRFTLSWSIWQRSLISRSVLLASILLSNAFPIFLIATSSFVSEFVAQLPSGNINHLYFSFLASRVHWVKIKIHISTYSPRNLPNLSNECSRNIWKTYLSSQVFWTVPDSWWARSLAISNSNTKSPKPKSKQYRQNWIKWSSGSLDLNLRFRTQEKQNPTKLKPTQFNFEVNFSIPWWKSNSAFTIILTDIPFLSPKKKKKHWYWKRKQKVQHFLIKNKLQGGRERYQTMPYAPRPTGWIGGTYLAETSKRLPRMLYCMYLPPYKGRPSLFTLSSLSISFLLFVKLLWERDGNKNKKKRKSCSVSQTDTHREDKRRRKREPINLEKLVDEWPPEYWWGKAMEGPFGTTGLSLTATTLKSFLLFQTFQLSNLNAEKPKPRQRLLFVIYKSQSISEWSIFSLSFFLA